MTSASLGQSVPPSESDNSTASMVDKREQRREARRALSREAILDAAERVFGEDGPRDGSLRRIAELSGFSPAGIYVFFESKQELLAETLTRRGDGWIATMQIVAQSHIDPMETLHRIIDLAVEFFARYPKFRLLLRHIDRGTTMAGPVDPAEGHYLNVVALIGEVISRGQENGEIRNGSSRQLAHLYSVLVNEYVLLGAVDAATEAGETLSLEEFHDIVDGAFRSGRATAG